MKIVLGAAGQVGSAIIDHLLQQQVPVRAVLHHPQKADELRAKGAQVAIADSSHLAALETAFREGESVFVLTPETGKSADVIGDTKNILANYRAALSVSPITKVVGLSSIGAQNGAGNLKMSQLLEAAFEGMDVQQIFVRPSYYYSNWLPYLPTVKAQGILPTFYPPDLSIPMMSPLDVAAFVADLLRHDIDGSPLYELEGPQWYSSADVAATLGEVLGRPVEAQEIPSSGWTNALKKMGFTPDATKNFIEMTEAVVSGQAQPEGYGMISIKTKTTLKEYLEKAKI